ncbi:M1 family metallopeptidase [Marinicella rhabdoformis]|uniref:M1 family metallopeptidase n=1 Tax=Marinicella rhabdoformis TaxID=2580566 RepID=UPI0012AEC936|nr:M1 family metallopeptidase [Marinicella rhabdoformis]
MKKNVLFSMILLSSFNLWADKNTSSSLTQIDPHSFANFDQVKITHMTLDLTANFKKKRLEGSNTISYDVLNQQAKYIILDTRDLDIKRVTYFDLKKNGLKKEQKAIWDLLKPVDGLGSALKIKLPEGHSDLTIHYHSLPQASGLQWLSAEQTAEKQHPFLFSQSQAIHARSWIPSQDSPTVRTTYQAKITAPKALRVVMSAKNNPEKPEDGVYQFNMPQAIPAYLIAIAIGDLEYKNISEHVSIYAEKTYIEKAAYEFAETENMITEAEKLYGEYRWGDYDLLILPPSFPFGGMENPRLSFITPTVIAGDRSLDSLIAHELAHSWSGNLVTNGSWRDLWLNEGFTSYFEARITEAVHGTDRMKMEAALNLQGLKAEMAEMEPHLQALVVTQNINDPDDVFSGVAYDKGRFFLEWLEVTVGRKTFDAFLNGYFDHFAFKSVSTEKFLAYLDKNLITQSGGKITMEAVKEWIYKPGLPDTLPVPTTDRFKAIDKQVIDLNITAEGLKKIKSDQWTTQEWLHFMKGLPETLSQEQMQSLDDHFEFNTAQNTEIAHVWLLMSIKNDFQPAFERLIKYLNEIGRMKLIVPLYKVMSESDAHKNLGKNIYMSARAGYHNLARFKIDPLFPEMKFDTEDAK